MIKKTRKINKFDKNPYLSIREYKKNSILVKILWNISILEFIISSTMSILYLIYSEVLLGVISLISLVIAIISTIIMLRFYKGLKTGRRRQKKKNS